MTTMLFQGHGSYRFTLDDSTVIYVDPYFGKEYELEADLVLVTHRHFDHDAVDKMPHASGCEVIWPEDLHPTSDEYLSTESHGVKIQAVQAYNENHPSDECVGYVLEFDGVSFYAAGDTSMTEDMKSGQACRHEARLCDVPVRRGVQHGRGRGFRVRQARRCQAQHSRP